MPTKGRKIIENENFSNAREELRIQMKTNEGDKLPFFIKMPKRDFKFLLKNDIFIVIIQMRNKILHGHKAMNVK
jgi:hypothetical protein